MKKNIAIIYAAFIGFALTLSSCSNQIYSYRSKVKVDQQATVTPKVQTPILVLDAKKLASLPTDNSLKPIAPSESMPLLQKRKLVQTEKRALGITQSIKELTPIATGKANVNTASVNQGKSTLKDIKKAALGGIDGKQWMIIGLIVMLIAVVLGILTGVSFFYGIGVLIFLVGLVIFLLDNL